MRPTDAFLIWEGDKISGVCPHKLEVGRFLGEAEPGGGTAVHASLRQKMNPLGQPRKIRIRFDSPELLLFAFFSLLPLLSGVAPRVTALKMTDAQDSGRVPRLPGHRPVIIHQHRCIQEGGAGWGDGGAGWGDGGLGGVAIVLVHVTAGNLDFSICGDNLVGAGTGFLDLLAGILDGGSSGATLSSVVFSNGAGSGLSNVVSGDLTLLGRQSGKLLVVLGLVLNETIDKALISRENNLIIRQRCFIVTGENLKFVFVNIFQNDADIITDFITDSKTGFTYLEALSRRAWAVRAVLASSRGGGAGPVHRSGSLYCTLVTVYIGGCCPDRECGGFKILAAPNGMNLKMPRAILKEVLRCDLRK